MIVATLAAVLSLTLTDAISIALAHNASYQTVQAHARLVRGMLMEANAARLPTVDAANTYSTLSKRAIPTFAFLYPLANGQAVPQTATLGNPTQDELSLALRLVIYNGGALSASIGQATVEYAAAISRVAAVRADVMNQTTQAFYDLVAAERGSAIAHGVLDVAQANVRLAQHRVHAGTAARADLLRQQLGQAQAQGGVIDADDAVQLANLKLGRVIALDPATTVTPTSYTDEQPPTFPKVTVDGLLKGARERRPDLHAASQAVDAAGYAVRLARAGTLPTITFGMAESNTHPNIIGAMQPQLTTVLGATWRLFDGGLTRGRVAQAEAGVDTARIQLDQLGRDVDFDVRSSYLAYTSAQAKLAPAYSARTFAEESLRVSQIRFKAGVGTALELSDALLADMQAKTAVVDSEIHVRIAYSNLQRAAGLL